MLPDPLHPAVVHFPVVLAILLPIFALGALWTIRRGTTPRRAWAIPIALSAALAISSWVAVQTGEAQDERVERVVAEQPLEAHEEAAELFLTLTGVLVLIALAGLAPGIAGRSARVLATGGAIALVAVAANVGHSGGELVYRYGAASAYTGQGASGATASADVGQGANGASAATDQGASGAAASTNRGSDGATESADIGDDDDDEPAIPNTSASDRRRRRR